MTNQELLDSIDRTRAVRMERLALKFHLSDPGARVVALHRLLNQGMVPRVRDRMVTARLGTVRRRVRRILNAGDLTCLDYHFPLIIEA